MGFQVTRIMSMCEAIFGVFTKSRYRQTGSLISYLFEFEDESLPKSNDGAKGHSRNS
jgi:hypothetical protein